MIIGITTSIYEDSDKQLKKALETGRTPRSALSTQSGDKIVGFIDKVSVGEEFLLSDDKSLLVVGGKTFQPVVYKNKAFRKTSKIMFTEI